VPGPGAAQGTRTQAADFVGTEGRQEGHRTRGAATTVEATAGEAKEGLGILGAVQALEGAGMALIPAYEARRRDGSVSFRLYRLAGP